ncbi:hypothetical protein NM688_g910 [Phlebia brevispora]|uniref:Uncharacterized protein n=1 Tax=Phlebia brevispora TaxID=194682 RepID=A0ACC1TCN2_9APHY|nr:hypothetical protein NM688_g910 [Phlebia brevispora]
MKDSPGLRSSPGRKRSVQYITSPNRSYTASREQRFLFCASTTRAVGSFTCAMAPLEKLSSHSKRVRRYNFKIDARCGKVLEYELQPLTPPLTPLPQAISTRWALPHNIPRECLWRRTSLVSMNNINQRMNELLIDDASKAQQIPSSGAANGATEVDPLVAVPHPPLRTKWQLFGWRLDDDWMVEYGKPLCDPSVDDEWFHFKAAVKDIQCQSGISRLVAKQGMRIGCNPWDPKEPIDLILTMMKPTSQEYRTRPTQSQADKVSEILGYGPEWFLDAKPVMLFIQALSAGALITGGVPPISTVQDVPYNSIVGLVVSYVVTLVDALIPFQRFILHLVYPPSRPEASRARIFQEVRTVDPESDIDEIGRIYPTLDPAELASAQVEFDHGIPDPEDEEHTESDISSGDESDVDYGTTPGTSNSSRVLARTSSIASSVSAAWSVASSYSILTLPVFVGTLKDYQEADAERLRFLESEVNNAWDSRARLRPNQLGRVLAYMMGLGKTVVTIYLICTSCAISRRNLTPTLVICPNAALLHQWESECKRFTRGLRVLVYHSSSRNIRMKASQLKSYDIVFATYHQVSKQRGQMKKAIAEHGQLDLNDETYPFFNMSWYRVVADESHFIRRWNPLNPGKFVLGVFELTKRHGLCLTGTPMQNSPADMYPQIRFLGPIYDDLNKQNKCIAFEKINSRTFEETRSCLKHPFKHIMDRMCIYRLDTTLDGTVLVELPNKETYEERVDLTEGEMCLYKLVDALIPGMKTFARIMRQRQACVLPYLLEQSIEEERDPGNSIHVDQDQDYDVNEVFIDMSQDLWQGEAMTKEELPLSAKTAMSPSHTPTKFKKTLQIIEHHRRTESGETNTDKVIVFSWFKGTLRFMSELLAARDIGHEIFNGDTSIRDRRRALKRMQDDPACTVLLMSIQAGGVGLNITSCNVVVLLEPWWNPFVEEQACGRVWRIGQEKPVTIYKIIARNTIEDDRILPTQQMKRTGVELALSHIRQ